MKSSRLLTCFVGQFVTAIGSFVTAFRTLALNES
jgi:hypothetical protein